MTRPYEIVGAGQIASSVWKTGDERSGWAYHFNIFRMNDRNGHVSQSFRPADVEDLVKLCRVLAMTLADDGCVSIDQRSQLTQLAADLDTITSKRN